MRMMEAMFEDSSENEKQCEFLILVFFCLLA